MASAVPQDLPDKYRSVHQAGGKDVARQAQVTATQAVDDMGKVGLADPGQSKQYNPGGKPGLLSKVLRTANPVEGIRQHGCRILHGKGQPFRGHTTQDNQHAGQSRQHRADSPVAYTRDT